MSVADPALLEIKNTILRDPRIILEDRAVIQALIEANGAQGRNVVDLRGVLVDTRAGAPLGPVGDLNQSVIGLPLNGAATYFGTNFAATGQRVMLREAPRTSTIIYGREDIGSEALIRLDFGPGTTPGLLAIGALDEKRFNPQQGIDLLAFLGEVFEKSMRRWLA